MTNQTKCKTIKYKGCGGTGLVNNWVMGLGNSPEECCSCKGKGVKIIEISQVTRKGK